MGKIYFWGFAHGNFTKDPVATEHSSFDELFRSLDPPMILPPVMEPELNQPIMMEKLRRSFDDSVCSVFIVVQMEFYA